MIASKVPLLYWYSLLASFFSSTCLVLSRVPARLVLAFLLELVLAFNADNYHRFLSHLSGDWRATAPQWSFSRISGSVTSSYILLLQTFNMVVEIPRFSQAKFEINRERPLNPIRQDQIEDFNTTTFSLRSLINVFPFAKIEYFIQLVSLQCHTVREVCQ